VLGGAGALRCALIPYALASVSVANCDFYALNSDVGCVLDFVFSQPGWQLYELASQPDSALRQFATTEEVLDASDLPHRDVYLHLYAPEMGGGVYKKRLRFAPNAVPGATFRYDSHGWGLIQLYFGGLQDGQLKASHTNHNSEARARRWEPNGENKRDRVADWNWRVVTQISSRLNRFLRTKATSKLGSRPILPAAFEASQQGTVQLTM
jgi:hypothetical protein